MLLLASWEYKGCVRKEGSQYTPCLRCEHSSLHTMIWTLSIHLAKTAGTTTLEGGELSLFLAGDGWESVRGQNTAGNKDLSSCLYDGKEITSQSWKTQEWHAI